MIKVSCQRTQHRGRLQPDGKYLSTRPSLRCYPLHGSLEVTTFKVASQLNRNLMCRFHIAVSVAADTSEANFNHNYEFR